MKQRILTVSTLVAFAFLCISIFALLASPGCASLGPSARDQALDTRETLVAQNADPATLPAVKEANEKAIIAIDKALPSLQSAASGDLSGAILTVGNLLPPPFNLAALIASVGWGIFERSRRKVAQSDTISVVTAIEKAKEKPTEEGIKLKTSMQTNAALIDANLTPGAKEIIKTVSGTV